MGELVIIPLFLVVKVGLELDKLLDNGLAVLGNDGVLLLGALPNLVDEVDGPGQGQPPQLSHLLNLDKGKSMQEQGPIRHRPWTVQTVARCQDSCRVCYPAG